MEPKNDNDSVPWYTECIWCFSKVSFLRRLCKLVLDTNVSLRISGDKPRWILNISVAKTCKLLWCIETELSLFSSSWNIDVLSWYVIVRALSCIEFILLLRRLLRNIQINQHLRIGLLLLLLLLFYLFIFCNYVSFFNQFILLSLLLLLLLLLLLPCYCIITVLLLYCLVFDMYPAAATYFRNLFFFILSCFLIFLNFFVDLD